MDAKGVLKKIKDEEVQIVDLRFMDFPGQWQHTSFPAAFVDADALEEGFGFDGSSIRGWKAIDESDMLLMPDCSTAMIDPFMAVKTLAIYCNIHDPITREPYTRDPRNIAQKAEAYLKETGIADAAFFGPELEFFIFDEVLFDNSQNAGFFKIDSREGRWNTGKRFDNGQFEEIQLSHIPRYKEGYFPVPPIDSLQDLRSEMVLELIKAGIDVECHHHEVATGGQAEIDMKFATLTKMADQAVLYKYIIKNVAHRNGRTVTFMPKPLYGDNGSGMHVHMSLWKDGQPLFAGNEYAGISEMALHAIGGILKHASSIVAFACPTTNSFKRLVPGYEAPINLAYSQRNRSAAVRIPMYSASPKSKRIEFRTPDPSCNTYLAFSAMVMAALDGIENKIDPGEPLDRNIYDLPAEIAAKVPKVPAGLDEALAALEADHEYLLKGDVFTKDVIEAWIDYKMTNEVQQLRLRPAPIEFSMYYDC
ncbi:type I glutamate--ammonia ligase [Candidatus Sumerlaeota bacterium]|nr:type I glutamate--ammonia ligase [Candidatus Sumerlaeota bacterium]